MAEQGQILRCREGQEWGKRQRESPPYDPPLTEPEYAPRKQRNLGLAMADITKKPAFSSQILQLESLEILHWNRSQRERERDRKAGLGWSRSNTAT